MKSHDITEPMRIKQKLYWWQYDTNNVIEKILDDASFISNIFGYILTANDKVVDMLYKWWNKIDIYHYNMLMHGFTP